MITYDDDDRCYGYDQVLNLLVKGEFDKLKLHLTEGLDINAVDEDGGGTVVFNTHIFYNTDRFIFFIENGGDLRIKDNDGYDVLGYMLFNSDNGGDWS